MTNLTWFLLALPLALDVFAVGLVFGLTGWSARAGLVPLSASRPSAEH